jgi:hypothetical protein
MDTFLPLAAFAGTWNRHAATRTSILTEATFSGHLVFANWQRVDVQRLLPPDLDLCINSSPTPHLHPVVFIFGDLSGGTMRFGGLRVPTPVNYRELGICVPFVRIRGTGVHTHMVRMYSSYDVAIWNGNVHYGFSKQMAHLGWRGPVYLVTAADGALLLHVTVETTGAWRRAEGCELPNFAAMRAVFTLPVIGRKANGQYVTSYFSWDFAAARVRPADACVSIDTRLIEGVAAREYHDVTGGTVEMHGMVWRLSWPIPAVSW